MPKKNLILGVGAVVLLLLIGGGGFAWQKMRSQETKPAVETTKKKKVSEPVNVISVAERPYVKIMPKDAYHIAIVVESLKKPATEVEYELEYQAGTLLQGAFDMISLASVPATKEIFFGSCSAGGACTKHEDVKGGTLLTKFTGPTNYALKSEWRFFLSSKDGQVASKDAKFQLTSDTLKKATQTVVFNTPGYPEGLTGTPVSDPYSLQSASTLTGKGTLTMRANEEGDLTIMGWDGKAWKVFTTKVDGKSVSANVDLVELYIVIKK